MFLDAYYKVYWIFNLFILCLWVFSPAHKRKMEYNCNSFVYFTSITYIINDAFQNEVTYYVSKW